MNSLRALRYLTVLLVLAPILDYGKVVEKKSQPFRPSDYPRTEFRVTQSIHTIGDIKIRIIHAKRRRENVTPPSYCRAWVEISRDQKLLKRIYYADFEPVGYKYGVFVPAKQPSDHYFTLVKEGDYDGRLILASRSGAITDTIGGSYFVVGGRYLVSQYSSDEAGPAVFDLQVGKIILQTSDIPYIQRWYRNSRGYFFTESEWSQGSGEPHEKSGVVYRLDIQERRILKTAMNAAGVKSAKVVDYDFDPSRYENCTSK